MKLNRFLACVVLYLPVLVNGLYAQGVGSSSDIKGTITDPSGALMPGVSVAVVETPFVPPSPLPRFWCVSSCPASLYLLRNADALGALLDPTTGEYYFSDAGLERRFPSETRTAVRKRIGNIALISELRQQAGRVLKENSVVLSKVLYSGTHSGDAIDAKVFPRLEQELSLLHRHGEKVGSEHLKQFAADMIELITAAKSEGNPIVF